jgi:phosphatidate phosphatase PAH1
MIIFRTCIGVTLLGAVLGFAQEKADPQVKQAEGDLFKIVRVQVEYIEVPHETMTELLFEPRNSVDDTPLRAKLQELVKEGKAKMTETQMANARSGQSASTESVHEYIYPIEYEAPQLVMNNVPENDKPQVLPPVGKPPFPAAWETRNIGSTLEIRPTISENDKVIDLLLNPTLVYHTGNNVWHEETKGKDTYRVQMPNFYKVEVNTSVTLVAGQPFMMAAVSPKDEKGEADFTKKVLIFVRADILMVGK